MISILDISNSCIRKEIEVHSHHVDEKSDLFHSFDGGSTEIEYLNLLSSLIGVLKPNAVLETGCYFGYGTSFMAAALKQNGFGKIISLDSDLRAIDIAKNKSIENNVSEYIDFIHCDSISYLEKTDNVFDFSLFDSFLPIRAEECKICIERKLMKSGSVVSFHDSSKLRTPCNDSSKRDPESIIFWQEIEKIRHYFSDFFEFPLSRGLLLSKIK